MPRLSQNAQFSFDWIEPDPLTLAKLAKLSIDAISVCGKAEGAILLGCGRNKKNSRSNASELYTSARFQLGVRLADRLRLPLYIISAKYGLVRRSETIDPYDLTIDQLSESEKRKWALQVAQKMKSKKRNVVTALVLADDNYADPLVSNFSERGINLLRPLSGLPHSAQLPFLKECHRYLDRIDAVGEFYHLFDRTQGSSKVVSLRDAIKEPMPAQGVYFFFDPAEPTRFSTRHPRLVRIGTHGVSEGSKATLRDRLRAHLGTADGYGNHRSSVFRLHVGEALIRRDNLRKRYPEWGRGQTSSAETRDTERSLERKVSDIIGNLLVRVVAIADRSTKASARSVVERLAIALFTENFQPVEAASSHWLGLSSQHDIIAQTGLWNLRDAGTRSDFRIIKMIDEYCFHS